MFSSLKYFQMLLWIFWISQVALNNNSESSQLVTVHGNATLSCPVLQEVIEKDGAFDEASWLICTSKRCQGIHTTWDWIAGMNRTENIQEGREGISMTTDAALHIQKVQFKCKVNRINHQSPLVHFASISIDNKASATISEIFAYHGMPKVHLPCFSIETELGKQEAPPKIESMSWIREDKKIIVKDENGIRETFRRLTLSGPIQSNANLTNVQYYGRVNFSASYGLIINNVKADDGGTYLCRYKTTETKASGLSEVKLVVFEPPTVINGTFNTSRLVNDTTEPSTIIIDTFTTSLVNDTTDNYSEDSSCIIWKAVVGVLAVSFTSLLLGGVLKQCWPYIKRVCLLTHAAGGNDRTDDSDQPEENHVLNEFAGVDGQSIPNGSPCIAHAITRPSKGMGNCVSNENASAQCIPQVSSGSPRIRNGYVVGNTEDRSIPQVGNTHPSDDDLENCVSSGYAADKAKAQRIPEGLTIAYPNGNYRYYYN